MQDWMFEVGGDAFATMMTLDPWADEGTGWTEPETVEPPRDDWLAAFLTTSPVVDGLDPLFMPPTGDDPPPHELDDVIITRPKPPPENPYTPPHKPGPPPGVWIDEGRDPPPGGGGGGDPVANDTPCVETEFESGADRAAVNNAALRASIAIAAANDEQWEYSVIIYLFNGNIEITLPYTDQMPGEVNLLGRIGDIPSGSIILGLVHNHPDLTADDDRVPANKDWQSYSNIQSMTLPRGITADAGILLYIKTNQDGKTRVYDKNDRNTQMPSCSID